MAPSKKAGNRMSTLETWKESLLISNLRNMELVALPIWVYFEVDLNVVLQKNRPSRMSLIVRSRAVGVPTWTFADGVHPKILGESMKTKWKPTIFAICMLHVSIQKESNSNWESPDVKIYQNRAWALVKIAIPWLGSKLFCKSMVAGC